MQRNTGWRKLAPSRLDETRLDVIDKDALYQAARNAGSALGLASSSRAILMQLVGFYEHVVAGRAIVWPSNETLCERTGLSERQIRYSIREMVVAGVIGTKDSANGKRFAIRSKTGQILDAFGLDLSPLLRRFEELKALVAQKLAQKAADKRLREEVTIIRRTIEEALLEHPGGSDFHDLTKARLEELRLMPIARSIEAWRALQKAVLEEVYSSGSGGSECRLIETNNENSDQSCNKSSEKGGPRFDLGALLTVCHGALEYADRPLRDLSDVIDLAARLRGMIGAHKSAWDEACMTLGRVKAAASVLLVMEIYTRDQARGTHRIKNAGGYFRAYVRMVAEGRVDLCAEIEKLR